LNLRILALDFDGTIAVEDRLDRDSAEAIREARASGLLVVLVTGRRLAELDALLLEPDLFDAIVGENGAVLRFLAEPSTIVLGRAPNPKLLFELERRGIQHRHGQCVIEAEADTAPRVQHAIHLLGLSLGISFNHGRLMVLWLHTARYLPILTRTWHPDPCVAADRGAVSCRVDARSRGPGRTACTADPDVPRCRALRHAVHVVRPKR
jgi:hypothetical protein